MTLEIILISKNMFVVFNKQNAGIFKIRKNCTIRIELYYFLINYLLL